MQPFLGGPTYCETPPVAAFYAVNLSFPVEPMNTVSNGVIMLFGLAALYLTIKRAPRTVDLYVLSVLLIFTGFGSGMWHGFRDGIWLQWEVLSGLFFLFTLVFCWARRLWSYLGATVVLLAFYLGFQYSREFFGIGLFGIAGRWVAIAPLVIGTGIVMITQTYFRSKQAALTGGLALASGLVALTFRTVDLSVCPYIPWGTHSLWHSFLSAGGFLGILTLMRLPAVKKTRPVPVTSPEAAE